MDLERVAAMRRDLGKLSPEEQERAKEDAKTVAAALERAIPAVAADDRAHTAWHLAQVFAELRELPVSVLSNVLADSAIAHGIAAGNLLWGEVE